MQHKDVDTFTQQINWKKVDSSYFANDSTWAVLSTLDEEFETVTGITKMVIFPPHESDQYVIKIPFNACWKEEDEGWFEEMSQAYYPLEQEYGWDYCKRELEIYELAKAAGIKEFFPITKLYADTEYPIYIQETCEEVFCTHRKPAPNNKYTIETVLQLFDNRLARNLIFKFADDWILDTVQAYGTDKFITFINFLITYDLNDFHAGNYGYAKADGRPVLIDFSGFYEDSERR